MPAFAICRNTYGNGYKPVIINQRKQNANLIALEL